MKKRVVFLVVVFICALLNAQNQYFIYVPQDSEISNSFGLLQNGLAFENGTSKTKFDEDMAYKLLSSSEKNSLFSLSSETFLRQTKNRKIQKTVLKVIKKKNLDTPFTNLLKDIYDAKSKKDINGNEFYTSKDEKKVLENIDMLKLYEARLWDGEFCFLVFDNAYTQGDYTDKQVSLSVERVSESYNITVKKYKNCSTMADAYKIVQKDNRKGRYPNFGISDVSSKSGTLARANADGVWLGFGTGKNRKSQDEALCILYLYSKQKQCLYAYEQSLSIAENNMLYPIKHRLYNQLILMSFMSYIQ